MSASTCGCAHQPCGCCEGVQQLTPADEFNRPGLAALRYRVGTHGQFLASMKARLSTMEVDGVGSDGQTHTTFRPLQSLTTRDSSDAAIALLDAWATVGDVLGFYQERIANENYLRTATERRSVAELARLVGYQLRPGVAASTYLAYTLDSQQQAALTVRAGAAAQSVPDPDQQPQTFETSEDLVARPEWNNLQVRLSQPQDITFDNVLALDVLHVAGNTTGLRAGDKLLFTFTDDGATAALRTVASVESQFVQTRSAIALVAVGPVLLACRPLLLAFLIDVRKLAAKQPSSETERVLAEAEQVLRDLYLGAPPNASTWAERIRRAAQDDPPDDVLAAIDKLHQDIAKIVPPSKGEGAVTDPTKFVQALLKPPVPQVRNSLALARSLRQAFAPASASASTSTNPSTNLNLKQKGVSTLARRYTDVSTQLLVNFVPHLAPSYYAAWAGAHLNPSASALKAVHAFRARAALFGAAAARLPNYDTAKQLNPQNLWDEWNCAADETGQNAFLDQPNEAIAPGSYAVVERDGRRNVLRIDQASTTPRSAYGLSGQATTLNFQLDNKVSWRSVSTQLKITELRKTKLYVQSEPLALIDRPLTEPIASQQVPLAGLYKELVSGRWVVLSGERADIAQVAGVRVAELQMISGLNHGFDPDLPGDELHTTLSLSTPLAYSYQRDTLRIYGNVVKATQGGTRSEVLGSGDGAQSLQSFTLKQPPLTFVAAPTADGAQSTLHVYVDNVEWLEAGSLAWLSPKSRGFVTANDDAANTTITFGNGEHGTRLPSGVENVRAVYRSGIGAGGNVRAGQVTTLQSRPLGVQEVVNPLRASGGADKEGRDLARENAPLSVTALDRLVSVQDYEDFTRRFAGIAKALARRTSDGRHPLVYLTIAGTGDVPIDPSSDLYRNLLAALRQQGDPDLPLRVDLRERKALVLSARIKLLPGYVWSPTQANAPAGVASTVRATLLDAFGFDKRALGRAALLSEAISVIQAVPGVAWVDVDAFGAVPERVVQVATGADGNVHRARVLLTQDDIVEAVAGIVNAGARFNQNGKTVERMPPNVDAWPGGLDQGLLRPAEVVAFAPLVPDTLILNEMP